MRQVDAGVCRRQLRAQDHQDVQAGVARDETLAGLRLPQPALLPGGRAEADPEPGHPPPPRPQVRAGGAGRGRQGEGGHGHRPAVRCARQAARTLLRQGVLYGDAGAVGGGHRALRILSLGPAAQQHFGQPREVSL